MVLSKGLWRWLIHYIAVILAILSYLRWDVLVVCIQV